MVQELLWPLSKSTQVSPYTVVQVLFWDSGKNTWLSPNDVPLQYAGTDTKQSLYNVMQILLQDSGTNIKGSLLQVWGKQLSLWNEVLSQNSGRNSQILPSNLVQVLLQD